METQRDVFSEEHNQFREMVRRFCDERIKPFHDEWAEKHQVPRSLWKEAGELGMLNAWLPEEYGGIGEGILFDLVVVEELGRAGATGPGIPLHSLMSTPYIGTFPRILNHLPEGTVRELAYTGRKMGSQECKARGLYNEVYPDQETMLAAVMETARQIASKAPLAVYGCKRAITYSRDHNTADALDNIAIWNMSMLIPEEMNVAMMSAKQKRMTNFKDLPKLNK